VGTGRNPRGREPGHQCAVWHPGTAGLAIEGLLILGHLSYDNNEKTWNPPMPLLFQRRLRSEDRPITAQAIRELLNIALDQSGLTNATGQRLRFAPHDFRRLLITDVIMHGMPRTSPSWSPGTATSIPPWDTRLSTLGKSSTGTGRSSPGAGHCAPARNTGRRPTRKGRNSSATSSAAS
jgi:hypothetical protein